MRNVIGGQAEEEVLDGGRVVGARGTEGHAPPVAQLGVGDLLHRVGAPAAELLSGGEQAGGDGGAEELLAMLGMRDVHQRDGALAERAPEQVGGAVLGDDVVDLGAGNGHRLARAEREADGGAAVGPGGREADDGLPAGRADGAAVEVGLGGDAAVVDAVAGVRADLPGQVDGERLRHRDHGRVGRDHLPVADVLDREEGDARVAVDHVVETPRAHGHAGHDLPGVQGLPRARHDAALHEVHDRLGDDVGVDAQVAAVAQEAEHLVRDLPEADLERRAVLHDARHVAGDALGGGAERLVQVLDEGIVHGHDLVEARERNLALRAGPRHPRVDLGDDPPRRHHGGARHVHGDAEAATPGRVGRARLDQRHVEREPPALEQARHLGERHGHVVDVVRGAQAEHVATEVERAVAEGALGLAVDLGHRAVGEEVDELDAGGRRPQGLEGAEQHAGRGAGAADEDVVAAADRPHGALGRDRALTPLFAACGAFAQAGHPMSRVAGLRRPATRPWERQSHGRCGDQPDCLAGLIRYLAPVASFA